MSQTNPLFEIIIGVISLIIGVLMLKKIKIKTFYDIKGVGVGLSCLILGGFLLLKNLIRFMN